MAESTRIKKPRRLSLVRFNFEGISSAYWKKCPFKPDRVYGYLGELAIMGGHCVVADHPTGKIYSGYHTENFIELSYDEA